MDRGEPDTARARGVATVLLDVIQKRRDKRGVEIVDGEGRRRLREPLLRKPQELPKRIAIRGDRMRARTLLAVQTVSEEAFDET